MASSFLLSTADEPHSLVPQQIIVTVNGVVNESLAQSGIWFEGDGFLKIDQGAFLPFAVDAAYESSESPVPLFCAPTTLSTSTVPTEPSVATISYSSTVITTTASSILSSSPQGEVQQTDVGESDSFLVPALAGTGGAIGLGIVAGLFVFISRSKKKSSSSDLNDVSLENVETASALSDSQLEPSTESVIIDDDVGYQNPPSLPPPNSGEDGYQKPPKRLRSPRSPRHSSRSPRGRKTRGTANVAANYLIKDSELERGKKLGEGAFGVVFKGTWHHGDVAIKEVKGFSAKAREDLVSEAEHFATMQPHPNVVQFFGVCQENELCIVTDFCAGGSLVAALYEGEATIDLSREQIDEIGRGAGAGLAHLHCFKVIHRDIAARNVLLTGDFKAKLTDFGMAKQRKEDKQQTQTRLGPIRWMSPEQLESQRVDYPCDVFSFGVLLFEIYSREMPWKGLDNVQVAHAVLRGERMMVRAENTPPLVAKVMKLCWEADPDKRPSMDVVTTLLRPLMASGSSSRRKKKKLVTS